MGYGDATIRNEKGELIDYSESIKQSPIIIDSIACRKNTELKGD